MSNERKTVLWVAVAIAAAAGVALMVWPRSAPPPPPPLVTAASEPPAPPADQPLPPAARSDAQVRSLLDGVSSDEKLRAWLRQDGLVERAATVVVNLGEGTSPRAQLGFLRPDGPFAVERRGAETFMSAASEARYDAFARAVESVDANRLAQALKPIHGWLETAFHALGYPGQPLDAAIGRALQRLVAAPVAEGPLALKPRGAVYLFADDKLEALGAVEKHLLRMGPRNERIVQAKARELAAALKLELSPAPAR